jgi:hypothetical protein
MEIFQVIELLGISRRIPTPGKLPDLINWRITAGSMRKAWLRLVEIQGGGVTLVDIASKLAVALCGHASAW